MPLQVLSIFRFLATLTLLQTILNVLIWIRKEWNRFGERALTVNVHQFGDEVEENDEHLQGIAMDTGANAFCPNCRTVFHPSRIVPLLNF
ncbi:unnamed protein product [Gongylonema pulchrum]|uniref:Bestrophin homolog n=1 Tax=Gongylonema pulchrum TaxID=637853 RepID=A0A183D790_9BILA|nr:unnamed protein product [Gongylonema pulchrum]